MKHATSLAAALLIAGCAGSAVQPTQPEQDPEATEAVTQIDEDSFLWLEETRGRRALCWVKKENQRSEKDFASGEDFEATRAAILEVLDSDVRIPYPWRMGEYIYNFWRDADNPRGVWRRATLAEYRKADPAWETVLDIDELGRSERRKWVFKGAQCLKPEYRFCLVSLSPDGGDAVEVREFDTVSKEFVPDGFQLPAAKTQVSWIDRDHIFVGTDFGPGSMTSSSYPRIAKEWTRGTPLSAARTVFEGNDSDMTVFASHDPTPGFARSLLVIMKDFYHKEVYLLRDGAPVRITVPDDAEADLHREWLLVETKTAWTTGGRTWPGGALLAIHFDDFMAGKRDFTALFTPDEHSAFTSMAWTRNHLIITSLRDVQSRLELLTPRADGSWERQDLAGTPELSTVRVIGTNPDIDDEYWLTSSGYLAPTTLQRGIAGSEPASPVKQEPAFFDASRFTASQHFATSKDGTRVPYFQIAPKDLPLDGSTPTLLYGYGGFEISLLPGYSGGMGRAWLERGGVYVVANIRGGGEYGPRWHQAALKENRPRAYEDFAAVARDLIRRGVTSPAHLGAQGGSNGGLLMGNMEVSYPELFGAIVCQVPLLDMKRYIHLDAGTSWIAEYGDPQDPEQWAFIRTFSPYQLLETDRYYPPILFYTATSDDRVGPVQARKMAAKMLDMGYENVWFYENTEGGHGGGADNAEAAHMQAMTYEFLWNRLR